MAGSYANMALKVVRFNQLRSEMEQLNTRYQELEKVAEEKGIQVASLGSLAREVASLYGLKAAPFSAPQGNIQNCEEFTSLLDQLHNLRRAALTVAATPEITFGSDRYGTAADWLRLSDGPILWPVEGRITGAFGRRIDPFKGEGAFHRGVDISSSYGHSVVSPADGTVVYAAFMNGYGRMIVIHHGHGIATRYGHLSRIAVADGQRVKRGDILGYVGMSGRSTGPHLHYEVWLHGTPINPYKFLRSTKAHFYRASIGD
jgi:murein DD-endopeptidase MepM/ murein hydrolase activator NlpD